MKKNFKIEKDGKIYWISRSIAVHVAILCVDFTETTDDVWVLLEKRGPGCPDEVGKWADPTGYIDFDEGLIDAAYREVYEELGLDLRKIDHTIHPMFSGFFRNLDFKNTGKCNVTVRLKAIVNYNTIKRLLDNGTINTDTKSRGGEEGEVSEIKLLKLSNLDVPLREEDFAFGHEKLLNEFVKIWL